MADRVRRVTGGTTDLWWLGAVAGVVTMLFGLAALFWPGLTLTTFVYLFSAFVLVWGVIAIVHGFVDMTRANMMWWLSLLFGFFAVGVGVYLVRHPLVSFATLILLVGFTLIVRGAVDVVTGLFGAARSSTGQTLAMVAGALGVVAGVWLLTQPESAGVSFVWIVGLYALLFGPLMVALAMDARTGEA